MFLMRRAILIVLDSVGIGSLPDADKFGDTGANTLAHIYDARGKLDLPNMKRLGLGKLVAIGHAPLETMGCRGRMTQQSPGKDTTSGHWEITGVILDQPFPTYPNGFPGELIKAFEARIGLKVLGNCAASGTEIITELGQEHFTCGCPIVYTSSDSVFQIAAHEAVISLEKLYGMCRIARELLVGEHAVGRVIARPFQGAVGGFERNNAARKDFSLAPPKPTLLDHLVARGRFVVGIGKIGDIFAHRGIGEEIYTGSNSEGLEQIVQCLVRYKDRKGLIFTNLVDFDMVYGHRRNAEGYGASLEAFDRYLPRIFKQMDRDDIIVITADHGCDPTHTAHTDHTREYVPLLLWGHSLRNDVDLGTLKTFADCGQTIADFLGVAPLADGRSFKGDIIIESI